MAIYLLQFNNLPRMYILSEWINRVIICIYLEEYLILLTSKITHLQITWLRSYLDLIAPVIGINTILKLSEYHTLKSYRYTTHKTISAGKSVFIYNKHGSDWSYSNLRIKESIFLWVHRCIQQLGPAACKRTMQVFSK